jgi:ABC-type multidrug transport system fused ATPase/permease subunit
MPFSYAINGNETVVFTRLKSGCSQSAFIVIGSIFTIIGLCLLIFSTDPEPPLSTMRFIVPVFGIVAIIIGVKLPSLQKKQTPDQIIFDNVNGRVEVNQQHSDVKVAFMYYTEIENFQLKIKRDSSSSSSTRSSRSTYTYYVNLLKKDGGQWELLQRNSESTANEEIAKLKTAIDLQKIPVKIPAVNAVTNKFQISDYGHKTDMTWRNPLGYGPLFLFLFSVVFITMFYSIASMALKDEDMSGFFYFVGGFIALVFLFVIVGNVMKMIKNAKTIYTVTVTDSSLDYYEKDSAGRIMKDIRFPLTDLYAIAFSFSTENTLRKIFIYTREQFLKMKELESNPKFSVDYVTSVYSFYKDLVALDMQELTAVEALHVENFLQEQVKAKGRMATGPL